MLSAAITHQVLQQENPHTIEKVKAVLEKHPWYANQWQARLQDVPITDREMVLFMQAARWADDIRTQDKAQNRPPWHYINLPFKPQGQPASVQIREPEPENILTAIAENERLVKKENDPERRAIALAWLFHLVGDIHQPLHTAQLFTVDYPQGDRGGNEICVRVTQAGQPMDLHRFWDGVITSSSNLPEYETRPRRSETARNFSGASSPNLQTPTLSRGPKRASRLRRRLLTVMVDVSALRKVEIGTVATFTAAPTLPAGYIISARRIADRRMVLAGYQLADLLSRIMGK
jgi:S1/P1 Nuclease